MFPSLIVGGLLFWISAIVLSIAIIVSLHQDDNYAVSGLLTFLFCVTFHKMFTLVSLVALLWCTSAYLAIGGLWSIWRWYRYVNSYVAAAKAGARIDESYKIDPTYNSCAIMAWIAYWPFSVFWELSHNLLKGICNLCAGFYVKISANGQKELEAIRADLEKEREATRADREKENAKTKVPFIFNR